MNIRILFTLLLSVMLNCPATAEEMLVLRLKGGSKISYVLAENPIMTFSGGRLAITSTDGCADYELINVEEFCFVDIPTAIDNVMVDEVRFARLSDGVRIYGVVKSNEVMVFDTGGRQVSATVTIVNNYADVSLNAAPQGIYLIIAKGIATIKITKR